MKPLHIQVKKDRFGKGTAYYLEIGDIGGRTGMYGITLKEVLDEIEDRIREEFE